MDFYGDFSAGYEYIGTATGMGSSMKFFRLIHKIFQEGQFPTKFPTTLILSWRSDVVNSEHQPQA